MSNIVVLMMSMIRYVLLWLRFLKMCIGIIGFDVSNVLKSTNLMSSMMVRVKIMNVWVLF